MGHNGFSAPAPGLFRPPAKQKALDRGLEIYGLHHHYFREAA